MARITTYALDSNISLNDKLVGTDADDNNITKNYSIGTLGDGLISLKNIITGGGTLNTIPLFTPDGQIIDDSIITQAATGQGVTVTGQLNVTEDFYVTGSTELFSTLSVQGASTFNNVSFQGVVFDGGGNPGTAGQVLSSTGTGVVWIAGDTNTTYDLTGAVSGAGDYKVVLTGSDGTIDNVNFEAGNGISLVDQGTNTVSINAINNGTVTGTGTTNTLPIWSDGPNGTLGDSGITQTFNANNKIANITLATNGADPNSLSASFGTGGSCRFSVGDAGEFMRLTAEVDGFYKSRFRFQNKVTVDRDSSSVGPSLDVGDSNHTYAAAWFRNGVVLSNNPSGVQVDNTSMVIGAGNNDVVTGSDNCLAVGNNNQILSDSDNSLVVGQGNIIRNDADNCFAIGQSNIIDGSNTGSNSVRSQVLGFDNNLSNSYSSFIAGGNNAVTTSNNGFALGYSNTLQGQDSQFAFGESCTGPANGQNTFMIGSALTGSDKSMAVGFRNDTSSYPAIDYSNGLGETKFVVSVGSNSTSNAIIITEGGVNRGNPNVEQIPRIILPQQETLEFTSDADATAGGIPTGGLYRNGNELRINFNSTEAPGNEGLTTLTPHFQIATPGGSDTYTQLNNIVDFDWISGGGSGIYEYILPSATAVPYRKIRFVNNSTITASTKVHITAPTGETIDGGAFYEISKPYNGCAVWSDGVQWIVIQAKA